MLHYCLYLLVEILDEKIKAIRDALKRIGAPTTARELGIEREYIIEALLRAHEIRPERYTILGSGLTREAAEKLVEITGVCDE